MKTTGDLTFATTVVNAMTLGAYGTVGSFLGTDESLAVTLEGKVSMFYFNAVER